MQKNPGAGHRLIDPPAGYGSMPEEAANRVGFQMLTSVEEFKTYVRPDVLALEPAGG